MIFDAHSDYGLFLFKEKLNGRHGSLAGSHYQQLLKAGIAAEVLTVGGDFTLWGIDFRKPENVFGAIEVVKEEIKCSEGKYHLIESECDFQKITNDTIGILLALEGAAPLTGNLAFLDVYYSKGIRSIMLTANNENAFSGGCQTPDLGLSSRGYELLRRVSEKPIMLDLAHISERAFFEVMDFYETPVIVSHANVKELSNHFRNLSDEQLLRLGEHHGVIGISLVSLFIENSLQTTSLTKLKEHVLYVASLIGLQCTGLGADMMDYMEDAVTDLITVHNLPPTMFTYPEGIERTADIGKVAGIIREDFPEDETRAITYGNFEAAYRTILKKQC